MSYYQNGQQYPYYQQQPPLPPIPQQPHRQDGHAASPNATSPYGVNGTLYPDQNHGQQTSMPHPYGGYTSHQNAELFIDASQQTAIPTRQNTIASNPYSPQATSPSYSPQAYNPQDYQPMSPTAQQFGSPALGRRPSAATGGAPLPYNPADYVDNSSQQYGTPGSYQHGFSPGYTMSSQPTYTVTPPLPQASAGARPPSTYSNRPSLSTSYSSQYNSAAPPPLPAIPSAGDSPSADWGQIPSMTRYTSRRYHRDSDTQSPPLPTPPPHVSHSRQSSGFSYSPLQQNTTPSPGGPPPQPPPHAQHLSRSDSRPLPRLPSNDSSSQGYFLDSTLQQELENQILAKVGGPGRRPNGVPEGSDSDLEALAGLEAMKEADRQEEEEYARRQSGQSTLYSNVGRTQSTVSRVPQTTNDSDSDIPAVDLGSMGGGWGASMSFGDSLAVERSDSLSALPVRQSSQSQTISSSGSRRISGNASEDGYGSHEVRVDAFGTGGLADPSLERRMSFSKGDESELTAEAAAAGYEFFHPGIQNRPLPPPPQDALRHSHSSSAVANQWRDSPQLHHSPSYPPVIQPPPNRHTSMVNHNVTPTAVTPARAITDADASKRIKRPGSAYITDSGEDASSGNVPLDLPGVAKRFNPAKLSPHDMNKCKEPWAMSSLGSWLKELVNVEQYLKKPILAEALVSLFTYKVRTMNIADAETLAAQVIEEMIKTQTLYNEEEWLFFSETPSVGVIYQLTGSGCYSSYIHSYESPTRCYSHHCQRTEKKIALSSGADVALQQDWISYWKLTKDDMEGRDRKEIDRQNNLHELVQKEENFLSELAVLRNVYRDNLETANPPVIPPKKLPGFIKEVFGKLDAVRIANEDHLVMQIKYLQKEQGPWVHGFSAIYREWIRRAKVAYIDYSSIYPYADYKVRLEQERNMLFKGFMDVSDRDPRSKRLGFHHFLKVPITHIQQVILLLDTTLKKSVIDNEEKRNLQIAVEEIKAVTKECDSRVADAQRKTMLHSLQTKLKLRPDMPKVELNLDHLGRELVHQGELLRAGQNKFNLLETHAILFDHFLVLAKHISTKTGDVSKPISEQYDVSRLPIPMDLLVLESLDDDPVVKSSLAGVTKVTQTPSDRLTKAVSANDPFPGRLPHSMTSGSTSTYGSAASIRTAPASSSNIDNNQDNKIMYPFRIKHLGRETYTLYSPSAANREEWCGKIIEAKTNHAKALFKQNAEPFKLKVIADTAFAYEGVPLGTSSIPIKDTPLDRAVREVEAQYVSYARPGPVCRAKVNCATTFTHVSGKQMIAVGTDFGVFMSTAGDPRGWQKVLVIQNRAVTQIAVLEDFQLFLLISDKSLIAYHLDVICPPNGVAPSNDSIRAAPQKLSGNRDVGFFATGRMKDRTLVFYKKRDVSSSTFKVLEPVLVKSTEKKSRFPPLRSGKTEFFRDFDEFYIPTECMSMNVFNSSIAIGSMRGFEILNLDRKHPASIPSDIDQPHATAIAQRLQNQKPLGMFRLNDQEFLLAFELCAVYVNKQGDISRSVIMEYVGKARMAAVYGPYVLLFDNDFVEVRNAMNGRLRQVIAGRDVKCLDDGNNGGSSGKRTIKVSMMHPEVEKCQIVVEVLLNEGLRE